MNRSREIIIVGAGPTGLLLANLLGSRGIDTAVLEREESPPHPMRGTGQSRAIGVTPPSLEILERVELADPLIRQGLPIRRAVVHGTPSRKERSPLGELRFEGVHHQFPYILSVPQHATRATLYQGVSRFDSVTVHNGQDVSGYEEAMPDSRVLLRCTDGSTWSARYCVAADGAKGITGGLAGIAKRGAPYRPRFLMGDYRDRSGLGDEAHLWFTSDGAVESFPLPHSTRRWIIQLGDRGEKEPLDETVRRRAGFTPLESDKLWESSFHPSWSEAETFHRGNLFLAGDAAHTMSPIGGQGMNTGFGDADLLTDTLCCLLRPGEPGYTARAAPEQYYPIRRRASRAATRRAAAGMFVGTIRGTCASAVRSMLVRAALQRPFTPSLARHFAMITIPR